jgi:hypothetical protein
MAALEFDFKQPLIEFNERLRRLTAAQQDELLDALGAEGASQTQRRIDSEKTDPADIPWRPWAAWYAATREPHHSLLIDSGDLLRGIHHQVEGDHQVIWGSDRDYAVRQNDRRQFLGLSADNLSDLQQISRDWLAETLGELT